MLTLLEPRREILPPAQQEVWPLLQPLKTLGFVLYGGTAVALHLGHRTSVDFDFFRTEPLDKTELYQALRFLSGAAIFQDEVDTLAVSVTRPTGPVGSHSLAIRFGRSGNSVEPP